MKPLLSLVVPLLWAFSLLSAFADPAVQTTPRAGDDATVPLKAAEAFFDRLKANQVEEAYDTLLKGTKIAESTRDVAMLKTKTREALQLGGSVTGGELIGAKTAGSRLMSLTYLSLGESFPLRWRFYFYKAADQWKLIDIRISDRLAEMLEEATPAPASAGEAGSAR